MYTSKDWFLMQRVASNRMELCGISLEINPPGFCEADQETKVWGKHVGAGGNGFRNNGYWKGKRGPGKTG
jgi:hypothetical protein